MFGNFTEPEWGLRLPMQLDSDLNLYTLKIHKQVKKKVIFKFIVNDDNYVISPLYECEMDPEGNENNYLDLTKVGSKVIH